MNARPVVEAAAPFTRVLVLVPEAYTLLGPHEATRPGLLVLDADGRRVDAFPVAAFDDPAAVAARLSKAATAPAVERTVLHWPPDTPPAAAAALAKAVRALEGVVSAKEEAAGIVVHSRRGSPGPEALLAAAAAAKVAAAVREPVPVTFTAEGPDLDPLRMERSLAALPGTWYAGAGEGRARAWVAGLLLDPAALDEAAGTRGDAEARTFLLPGVPTGPSGMRVVPSVRELPGVLSVVPDLAAERVTVVGRRGEVRWEAVLGALRTSCPDAKESAR